MLVNCVAYEEGRKLADIAKEDISEYLKRPNCFVWVGLKDPEPAELEEMRTEFDLHELAVEDARHGHQRPKIEEYGDLLFVVVNTVTMVWCTESSAVSGSPAPRPFVTLVSAGAAPPAALAGAATKASRNARPTAIAFRVV